MSTRTLARKVLSLSVAVALLLCLWGNADREITKTYLIPTTQITDTMPKLRNIARLKFNRRNRTDVWFYSLCYITIHYGDML